MKKLLSGIAALPFMAAIALAGQPTPLTDNQMDTVTAGFDFAEVDISNTSTVGIFVDLPSIGTCSSCYLQVNGTSWGHPGVLSMQVLSQFGP